MSNKDDFIYNNSLGFLNLSDSLEIEKELLEIVDNDIKNNKMSFFDDWILFNCKCLNFSIKTILNIANKQTKKLNEE